MILFPIVRSHLHRPARSQAAQAHRRDALGAVLAIALLGPGVISLRIWVANAAPEASAPLQEAGFRGGS